jgi:hypothetical protein
MTSHAQVAAVEVVKQQYKTDLLNSPKPAKTLNPHRRRASWCRLDNFAHDEQHKSNSCNPLSLAPWNLCNPKLQPHRRLTCWCRLDHLAHDEQHKPHSCNPPHPLHPKTSATQNLKNLTGGLSPGAAWIILLMMSSALRFCRYSPPCAQPLSALKSSFCHFLKIFWNCA